ncbi:MAG: SMC family ATPase [Pseudomonadota bacterium]
MIPLKLTIQGLYSYTKSQTINFENLTDSALFGIFGSVGSGKSTILEAISYALYGETERLNKKDSRSYNMMNLKSQELLIDFEFYTENKDTTYRFIVTGKRNKKNFDEVKSFDRRAFVCKQGQEQQPTTKTAEEIIGLNYKNFKRTIIIPQGKFKDFLELRPTERTDMLKEIFNLERFDLAPKLTKIKSENEQQLHTLIGRMEQFQELNSSILKDKQLEQTQLLILDKEQQAQLKKLEEQYAELKEQQHLFKQLEQSQAQLKQLQISQKLFDKRKTDLSSYSYCDTHFKDLLNSEYLLNKEVSQKQLQLASLEKSLQSNLTSLNQFKQQLKEIQTIYDKKDVLINEAQEIEVIIRIREQIINQEALANRIKKGDIVISEQKLELEQTQLLINEKKSSLKEQKQNLEDISELNNIKNFLIKLNDLEKRVKNSYQQLRDYSEQLNFSTGKIKDQVKEQFYNESNEIIIANINQEICFLTENRNKLNEQLNHLFAQQKLKQWADDLKDGEDCPVCGAKEHPHILNMDDLQSQLSILKQQDKALEQQIVILKQSIKNIEKMDFEVKNLQQLIEKAGHEKDQQQQQLLDHKERFKPNKEQYPSLNSIEKAIKKFQSNQKKITQSEQELHTIETQRSKLQTNIDKYIRAHQKFKDQFLVLETTIKNDSDNLELFSLNHFENEVDQVLLLMAKSKQEVAKKAVLDFENTSTKIEQITSKLNIEQGQEKILKELLNEKSISIKAINSELQEKLLASTYQEMEQIKTILKRKIDINSETQVIADFEAQLSLAILELEKIQQLCKNFVFDEQLFLALKQQITEQQSTLKKTNANLMLLKNNIKKLQLDLATKKQLQQQYQQLEKRQENINTLARLFKGQGFVKYISIVYLQNLCHAANLRFFKMTQQQLQLEITENPYSNTMDFQIRDFLNEGKTRSVKTLSGGQMFQASLSLALALADSVQSQIKAERNFFFLDEGFGSLDNESLHIVFKALKSLKEENRIVGIISHVESLKQEIDVHLLVTKENEQGSSIEYSWEL